MPSQFRKVTENFWVSPQLLEEHVAAAAEAGFRSLINNRPDGEEPGQPTGAQVEQWARAHGLDYAALPVSGQMTRETVEAMGDLVAGSKKPCLAFCRSGMRSISVWAMAESLAGRRVREDLLERGTAAGYDLSRIPI
ncbi:MAG: TIGR01244 family phosphatase [Caulobacteraceae bacterium]|nr:TIGR01244 family phosphatase [Caulobacteraceae bacterium]